MPASLSVQAVHRRASPWSLSVVLCGAPSAGEKHIARLDAGVGTFLASRPASPDFSCSGGPLLSLLVYCTVWRVVPAVHARAVCRAFLFRYTWGSQYRGALQAPHFLLTGGEDGSFYFRPVIDCIADAETAGIIDSSRPGLSLGCFAVDGDHGWHGNSPVSTPCR